MLLYLTSNNKSGLIDAAGRDKELTVKKLVGKFSLRSFVTKDMRNYATAKYFVVDFSCVEEQLENFIVALQSFQMMFSSRIIVILSGCEGSNDAIDLLVSIGVVNLVTADTLDTVAGELAECLSDEGMERYVQQPTFSEPEQQLQAQPCEDTSEEIIPYRWKAENIKIAVAGTQHRSGVTVTAFNMAAWLAARGAEVCYVEMNTNRHLQLLMAVFDAKKKENIILLTGSTAILQINWIGTITLSCTIAGSCIRSLPLFREPIFDCCAGASCPMKFRNSIRLYQPATVYP